MAPMTRRGRPFRATHPGKRQSAQVIFRLLPEELALLKKAAKQRKLSLSQLCKHILIPTCSNQTSLELPLPDNPSTAELALNAQLQELIGTRQTIWRHKRLRCPHGLAKNNCAVCSAI